MVCGAGGFFSIRILASRGRSPYGVGRWNGECARLVFARFSHGRANLTTGHAAFSWITAMVIRQFGTEAPGFLPSLS
jgi:hypothetical protein